MAMLIKIVMSVAEAEMGAMFINAKQAVHLRHSHPNQQHDIAGHGNKQNLTKGDKVNGYAIPLASRQGVPRAISIVLAIGHQEFR